MTFPKTIHWLLVLLLALGLLPVVGAAAPAVPPAEVDGAVWEALGENGSANVMVIMAEQADLSAAYGTEDRDARAWYVYETLTAITESTQAPLLSYLDGLGLAFHSFISQNAVGVVAADAGAVDALASMPGVAMIRLEGILRSPPEPDAPPVGVQASGPTDGAPDTIEWNILDVHADQVWAMGYRGEGIVVANLDTGVQYDHEALYPHYRGWDGANFDHDYNWWDPTEVCGGPGSPPCDNDGHGTWTMGVEVGQDANAEHRIGVAPGSTWMSCKGCVDGDNCAEFDLYECSDFYVAPWDSDGENPDPTKHPDVMNVSLADIGCTDTWRPMVDAWRAVGIFPAFAAGNFAPGCETLASPADYQESFGAAAYHQDRIIAGYSSRGPSCYGHDPHTKPNIAGPSNVCSSDAAGGYACGLTGTSFSCPHVAGAVALIWQACPDFFGQMEATFDLLEDTADDPPDDGDCGAPPDGEGNYTWGNGPINILAAVEACAGAADYGTLEGHVTDQDGEPIEGATVTAYVLPLSGGSIEAETDPNGFYSMQLVPAVYDVTAAKYGYGIETAYGVVVEADQTTVQDFALAWIGAWQPGTPSAFDMFRFDGAYNPHDRLIYFLGGRSSGSTHDKSIWTYDPASGVSADTGFDMLYNACNISVLPIDDDGTGRGEAMYLVGGFDINAGGDHNHVQRFYPQLGVVEEVVTDPYPDTVGGSPVSAGAYGVVDGKVYVAGGWTSAAPPYFSDKTWVFDPQAPDGSRWTQFDCFLSLPRSYLFSAVSDGKFYALGGSYEFDPVSPDLVPTDVAEVFDPAHPEECWQPIANLPVATSEGRGFGFDADTANVYGKIYLVGGGDWPDQTNEVLEYDIASDTWNADFPELFQARRDHAGAYVSDCTPDPDDGFPAMWVFGGRITGDEPPYGDPEFFPLPCEVGENTMHVHDIVGVGWHGQRLIMKVLVADQDHNPLARVTVDASITTPMFDWARWRYTNIGGWARFWAPLTGSGNYEICIEDLTLDGYTYVPGDNVYTCRDWDRH